MSAVGDLLREARSERDAGWRLISYAMLTFALFLSPLIFVGWLLSLMGRRP